MSQQSSQQSSQQPSAEPARHATHTKRERARAYARRVLSSPLGVAVSLALAVGAWSGSCPSAQRSGEATLGARHAHAQDDDLHTLRMHVPIPPAARTAASVAAITAGARPVPRLRADPNASPGIEIALQDANGHAMDHLHAALARAHAGQGQARLLFYGASHTAADIYTGYLRDTLQTMFGDAGHGFVLPVQPWRGYSHEGVQIARMSEEWSTFKVGAAAPACAPGLEDYYGVAGVAIESSAAGATAFVETARGQTLGSSVSRFDLYYLNQPHGGDFDVLLDGAQVQRVRTRASAPSSGYVTVNASDGAHRLEIRVLGTGPVRLFGVAAERSTPGVIVDVHGINGSRARSHLAWNDALYREQLARRSPDLVVLAYGTNESGDDNQPIEDYRANLELVVRRIRETVPNASCLLVGPSDRPVQTGDGQWVDRPRTAQIIDAQWRVALENGCAFFDVVAFQGGSMSTVSWSEMDPPYAGRDHVHFTRAGYERMGQVLLGAMLEGTSYPIPSAASLSADGSGRAPRARPE